MSTLFQDNPLAGRTAVVTGASSGFGAATAKLLAGLGAKVALLARRQDRLEALAAHIREEGGTAVAITVDVTDAAAVRAAADRVAAELGTTDLVVNNAGIMLPAPVQELRTDQWQHQIDLNISGVMNVIGAFTPQLVASAAERGVADLVNMSSIASKNIFDNFAVYAGTKAFVSHMSVTLRAELGQKGVRVSAIEPGLSATELEDHITDQDVRDWFVGAHDIMLQAEDIASAIAFTVALPARANLQNVTVMPTRQPS